MAPKIVVAGVSGRMGQMLATEIVGRSDCVLTAAIDRAGSDWIGRDLGEALGGVASGLMVTDDAAAALNGADAVIDFTAPEATLALAKVAARASCAHIIGTTGLSEDDLANLTRAAQGNVVVRAGNMSLGVNLLLALTQKVAAALDWDVEIVEAHHRHKVDAPSGTALMLGEAAAHGRGAKLSALRTPAREGMTGEREGGTIGFSAIRGGDIIGEHDVIFAGTGERIVLRHMATDRAIFARGAVQAALWAQGRLPGEYDMTDVLDL